MKRELFEIHLSCGTLRDSSRQPYRYTQEEIAEYIEPLYGSLNIFTLEWKPYDPAYKLVPVR